MKELLKKAASGGVLTEEESYDMIRQMPGDNEIAAGALLAVIAARGVRVPELVGCVRYLRDNMIPVPIAGDCADIVGTGGDGAKTFNISTAAAFTAAGAEIRIAKHGNRAVSSACGAADVLEYAGLDLKKTPEELARSVEKNGFAFLFARAHHPAMAKVAPLRQALGIRTIFNLAGPLANPALARHMVVGVYADDLIRPFAEVLRELGIVQALVVNSRDGMDEISSLAETRGALLKEGEIRDIVIDPAVYLEDGERRGTLTGGDVRENTRILCDILKGEDRSAKRGAVLLNAGALCMVSGAASDLHEGIAVARKSLDSGAALAKFKEAIR